eukprot:GHVS01004642.1.p1 GENE.GHVS01004642.1~~GHVS01004642.1.p1  ORF type:complete len:502 (-),score=87.40 GHVS01004642.1:227-1732(-)
MATLADSFLQDLEDLDDIVVEEESVEVEGTSMVKGEEEEEAIVDAVELYLRSMGGDESLYVVSDLASHAGFLQLMRRVGELKELELESSPLSDEYELIEQCNQYVIQLDTEILNIHKFLRDIYSKKFPELESIVYSPLEYISIVKRVQNETDLTKVDMSDLLPNTVIMAVTVAASMTTGTPLPPSELSSLLKAADEALHLAESRKDVLLHVCKYMNHMCAACAQILLYLESRMKFLAPNLTAILGSSLAARVLSHAGGLINLARMPAQNIMLIGSSKKSSLGFSSATAGVRLGIISMSEIIQGVPLHCRNRALKYVCGKSSLAARVDSFRESPDGEVGANMREEIIKALIKYQQPPPAPLKKSLPMPDEKRKSKRGGKRYRRMKEKYGMSEYRKMANRTKFGPEEEEQVGLNIGGRGLGMLGKSTGTGKVKVQAKHTKVQMPNKRARQMQQQGTSSVVGGTASLAFTPVQGIEFTNPEAAVNPAQSRADKYFSSTGTFSKQ